MDNKKVDFTLKIFFQMRNDAKLFPGVVNHIAEKEMVFRTPQKVRAGNFLKIHIPDSNGKETSQKQLFAEVTRAKRIGQMWEIGAFFVDFTPPNFSGESRRKHERYAVDLVGQYQRYDHTERKNCRIVDLSRGGVCFTTDEPFKTYNEVSLVILPQKRGLIRVLMETKVLILRSVHIGKGIYETSGPFTQVSRKEPEDEENGEAEDAENSREEAEM